MSNKKICYALFAAGICVIISCAPSREIIKSEKLPPAPTVITTPVSYIPTAPAPQSTSFPLASKVSAVPAALPGIHEPEAIMKEEFPAVRESDQAGVAEYAASFPPLIQDQEIIWTPTPIMSVAADSRPIATADKKSGTAGWMAVILIVIVLLSAVVYLYWRQTNKRRRPGEIREKPPSGETRVPFQYESKKPGPEKAKPAPQPMEPIETKAISEFKPVTKVRIKAVRRKKVSKLKLVKKPAKKAVKKSKILTFPKQNTG